MFLFEFRRDAISPYYTHTHKYTPDISFKCFSEYLLTSPKA